MIRRTITISVSGPHGRSRIGVIAVSVEWNPLAPDAEDVRRKMFAEALRRLRDAIGDPRALDAVLEADADLPPEAPP